jgi:hypothetical protein
VEMQHTHTLHSLDSWHDALEQRAPLTTAKSLFEVQGYDLNPKPLFVVTAYAWSKQQELDKRRG